MMRHFSMILAIAAAATLLAALQATAPSYALLTGPIRTAGYQTETVSSATFSVKVHRVRKARTIAYENFGRAVDLQSSGVWVVISAELRAFRETMPVRAATLVGASGRLYRQSKRPDGAPNILSAKTVQPGLPTTGIFVFELPEDETRGMRLLLSEQYDPQLRDQIGVSIEDDGAVTRDRLEIGKNGI
jgi:hypothetical protein